MIAGGVAGMLLADFGADVVKVEQPGTGDPLRQWTAEGQPFWWKVYARNKRYITLNLKSDEGRELLRETDAPIRCRARVLRARHARAAWSRAGTSCRRGTRAWFWFASPAGGRPARRASGQASARLVEAASGFAAMNGEPDGAPIVPAFPLADMTSALYAVNATMFALYHRDVHGGTGQVIDVSLFESLFSVLGPLPAEYQALGRLRGRNGSRSKNAGPRGCYGTSDGRFIAVSGSTPKMAERFLQAYGLSHLLEDDRFRTNEARVRHAAALDEHIASAIASRTLEENLHIIDEHELTAVAVQTVADIEQDAHWRARQLLVDVPNGTGTVRMHNVYPVFRTTPGRHSRRRRCAGRGQRRHLWRRTWPVMRRAGHAPRAPESI